MEKDYSYSQNLFSPSLVVARFELESDGGNEMSTIAGRIASNYFVDLARI